MDFEKYEDCLEPRRNELSNFIWSSKEIDTVVAYKQIIKPTPESHKEAVLNDPKIQEFLNGLSREKCIPKDFLETQVRVILDEIGYNKNLRVIRWLALILVRICLRLCRGIYINRDSILHTKSPMGNCPVIFVPSHRSYADFILMSFVCFTYNVEIPAIAAGMDFHGMWAMGSILRDTGAFFMRRSYNDDNIYWTTFKQYINQIVTRGELPIEFFIEGTRSRSNKSLMPKYGLLNMTLKPLFLSQVPDIIFVPINISYEKILEEKLFSFELLGVPKPKESTSAFFKSLSIIKEKYGSIHITFAEPISSKQFFGEYLLKNRHNIGSIHHLELSDNDKKIIPSLAHEIIYNQQQSTVLNIMNLIALIVNHNLVNCEELLSLDELKTKVTWFKNILREFNATVWCSNVEDEIRESLSVHKNLIFLNNQGKIDVVKNEVDLTNMNATKLKGYYFSENIMKQSIPFVMLYIYINPMLHYLVDIALIVNILTKIPRLNPDDLYNTYNYLRNLFLHEFVIYPPKIPLEYKNALNLCSNLDLIKVSSDGNYDLGKNEDIQEVLVTLMKPFFYSYSTLVQILGTFDHCDEKHILTEAQKKIAFEMEQNFVHPYSLNLDSFSHCLSALCSLSALRRIRGESGISYIVSKERMRVVSDKLEPYIFMPNGKNKHITKHKL